MTEKKYDEKLKDEALDAIVNHGRSLRKRHEISILPWQLASAARRYRAQ